MPVNGWYFSFLHYLASHKTFRLRISPATVTFILNEILTSSKDTIRTLAHSFDWYFFPIFNPDGYAYTFTKVIGNFALCRVSERTF